ncbi:MAG: SMC-Scp complex subunit ScpB [Bdellovibrionota bacterium]
MSNSENYYNANDFNEKENYDLSGKGELENIKLENIKEDGKYYGQFSFKGNVEDIKDIEDIKDSIDGSEKINNEDDDEKLDDEKLDNENLDNEKLDIELNAQVVEALLFTSGEEISLDKLVEVLSVSKEQVLYWIEELSKKYNSDLSSFELVKLSSGYQLRTKDMYSAYIRRLKIQRPRKLSSSALETLSIVAYRQPVMKSEIERIKGVDASPTIKTLISRNLIKIIGHADKIGQPALYGTTDDFLKVFSLKSLADLPNLREVISISEEPEEFEEDEEISKESNESFKEAQ